MRNELIPHNLDISIAFPGSIDTEGYEEEEKIKPEVTKKIEHSSTLLKPQQVATHVLNGIRNGDNYIVYDFDIHVARILSHGMAPRTYPIFDMVFAPLATLIGPIVAHFQFDEAVRKTPIKKSN
jgi:3-dehydrosphinganine reductase